MIPYEELYEKNGKKERGGGKVGRKEGGGNVGRKGSLRSIGGNNKDLKLVRENP